MLPAPGCFVRGLSGTANSSGARANCWRRWRLAQHPEGAGNCSFGSFSLPNRARTARFKLFRSLNRHFPAAWRCRPSRNISLVISACYIVQGRLSGSTNCSFLQKISRFRRFWLPGDCWRGGGLVIGRASTTRRTAHFAGTTSGRPALTPEGAIATVLRQPFSPTLVYGRRPRFRLTASPRASIQLNSPGSPGVELVAADSLPAYRLPLIL